MKTKIFKQGKHCRANTKIKTQMIVRQNISSQARIKISSIENKSVLITYFSVLELRKRKKYCEETFLRDWKKSKEITDLKRNQRKKSN